jgi:ADP-ribose pyrophosphatase YjhB (NUDIX family)
LRQGLTEKNKKLTKEILRINRRLQAIAQAGIHYANNGFDLQRYQELRELTVQLAAQISDAEPDKIRNLFTDDTGFQTPKTDIRAVVLKDDKILLVRERSDNRWSMPGGFADINYSPSEVAVKEVAEEAGLEVKVNRLLAVVDTDRHNFPPLEFHYYKLIILCDLIGGELRGSDETEEARFFNLDDLPELSEKRNTPQLFALISQQLVNNCTYLD